MKIMFNGLNQSFELSKFRYEHKIYKKKLYFTKHYNLTLSIYIFDNLKFSKKNELKYFCLRNI
jgi:hypothetical protein